MLEWALGNHLLRIEEDAIFCYLRGPCSMDEGVKYLGQAEQIIAIHNRCFLVTDVSKMTTLDPSVRRYVSDWFRRNRRVEGVAVFGADVATRAMVTLLVRAINLVGQNPLPVRFVSTEAEARKFIDLLRKQRKGNL